MNIKGIDVSYANKNVDFAAAKKAGVQFVIIRTGYKQKTDTMFFNHMNAAKECGMPVGVYCYCMSKTVAEAQAEAAHVLKLIEPYQLTYPVFYDIEDARLMGLSKRAITDIALAFCDVIRKASYFPAIYINPDWLENRVHKELLKKYDIWLAAWTGSASKPTKYKYGQTMWQWGASKAAFAKGEIDGDICYIDYPKKIKALGLNHLPEEKKTVAKYQTLAAVNVRTAPTTNAVRIATLSVGTTVDVVSKTLTVANGYKWANIKRGTSYAWAAVGTADGKSVYMKKVK